VPVERVRLGKWTGVILALWLGIAVESSRAQAPDAATLARLQAQAHSMEKDGKWNEALQAWCQIYGHDRQHAIAHEHIQICLRRVLQSNRHVDQSLREKVLSLNHSQALALYSEVLTTLQAAYVDRSKVSPDRLFRQGLDEFILSLNHPNFRKQHLASAHEREIRAFERRLREFMELRTVESVADAVALLKQLAVTAKRDLRIAETSVIVLEFVSGACNSLDEYTAYLSPADLASETMGMAEPSVVDATVLKDGIGYLRITHFRDTTAEELDAALATMKLGGVLPRAIVMDLRGNAGGLFSAAVQVVERFLPQGVVVSTQGQLDEFNRVLNVGGRMDVIDLPLIVLVDAGTASAAEVLAGAFRDHQRATLVGTATYGKGSIQRVLQFQTAEEIDPSGKPRARSGAIRITLARFFSPNGQAINGAGVIPHLVEQDRMRQLDLAMEQASRFVSVMPPR
jgi:hypothetical protein